MNYRIMVVDDEKNIREGIKIFLEDEDYEVDSAENGKEAIALLKTKEFDLILSDIRMSPIGGEQLLQHVVTRYPTLPVIILTGHGSVEGAVEAIHKGAYDFMTKPVDLDRLLILLKRALQAREIHLQNRRMRQELESQQRDGLKYTTKNREMQKIVEKITLVAPTDSTVLITGESGVGKEVLCNTIHKLSLRKEEAFISVHCAALSESLLESELFGHEKGAFTGAISQKKGRFELADGGTIFLDEIGEIDHNIQVKLLRVLQEQSFERVGGEQSIKVNVRIITATNKDLLQEVKEGRFREDLYYRLSVMNIEVPPLRVRKEDILVLAQGFLSEFKEKNNKDVLEGFSKEALQTIMNYNWPGNIRELRNSIESAVIMSQSKHIENGDLPETISTTTRVASDGLSLSLDLSMKEYEREIILAMLYKYNWNRTKVSEILEIGRKTLHNKIKEYNIEKN